MWTGNMESKAGDVPSQRASHPGRLGSWWAINVAWQLGWSSMHAPAVAQARDTVPSPSVLVG
jgi:hypothetical protein